MYIYLKHSLTFQFHLQVPCARVMCRDTDKLLGEEVQQTYATKWHNFISNRQWIALHPLPKISSSRRQNGQHSHLNDDPHSIETVRFRICQENKSSGDIFTEWSERNFKVDGARNFGA
jgi:hypothetical protein